jgi:hypothetical protein
MSAYISRDPYARIELHRERTYSHAHCTMCDSMRVDARGKNYLYIYQIVTDSGRVTHVPGHFCSVDCMRGYNS